MNAVLIRSHRLSTPTILSVKGVSLRLRNLKPLASRNAVSIASNVGINPIAIQPIDS
jgi:hypothetical protein